MEQFLLLPLTFCTSNIFAMLICRKLNLKIIPVEKYVQEYDQIKDSIMNTNAEIHNYFNYDIQDIFELER